MKKKQIKKMFILDSRKYSGPDVCILCGTKMSKRNYSEEHVFPKWLLKRYDLWNEKLGLLNKTFIVYRKVKVPICKVCNNTHLGRIEKSIEKATKQGFKSLLKLSKEDIYIWCLKIFFQVLYLETRLPANIKDKSEGAIVQIEALMQKYTQIHMFLNSARMRFNYPENFPGSVIIVKVQEYKKLKLNFDFMDNIDCVAMRIRLGEIGIIVCFDDQGLHQDMFKTHLKKLKKIYPLHPMQFAELSAIIFYIRSTMNRTTKSVTIERENGVEVNFLPLRGLSRKPLHDEWVVSDYAKFLSFYCGLPYEKCFQMPNQLLSYTKDDRGKLLRFKLSDKDGKIS